MDRVYGFLGQEHSVKIKAVSQIQLALALIATAWEPNLTGAVAVIGIVASVLGNPELFELVWCSLTAVDCTALVTIKAMCCAVSILQPAVYHH